MIAAPVTRLDAVPEPTLEGVFDATGLQHFRCQKLGRGRRYFDTVVVKASYQLASERIAERVIRPICVSDRLFDPARPLGSSLALAGEVSLAKPGADLILTGHARSDAARTRWSSEVVVRRGARTLAHANMNLTGPRTWRHRALRGWTLSEPSPAREVPIRYELAFGGRYERDGQAHVYRENPAGSGFFDPDANRDLEVAGPQWELPEEPITSATGRYRLAGYGPVARGWAPRLRYAGTRDRAFVDRLRREVAAGLPSDYPDDFDARFFHAAHPALQLTEPFSPGDVVATRGLTGASDWSVFTLPATRILAELHGGGEPREVELAIDTVHVDLDAGVVSLLHRLVLDGAEGVVAAALYEQGGRP